jgi:hypothetical protein
MTVSPIRSLNLPSVDAIPRSFHAFDIPPRRCLLTPLLRTHRHGRARTHVRPQRQPSRRPCQRRKGHVRAGHHERPSSTLRHRHRRREYSHPIPFTSTSTSTSPLPTFLNFSPQKDTRDALCCAGFPKPRARSNMGPHLTTFPFPFPSHRHIYIYIYS